METKSKHGPEPIGWAMCASIAAAKKTAKWMWGHWEGSIIWPKDGVFYVNDGIDCNTGKKIKGAELPAGAFTVREEYDTEAYYLGRKFRKDGLNVNPFRLGKKKTSWNVGWRDENDAQYIAKNGPIPQLGDYVKRRGRRR